jgi:S1-C subfamily serine protease
MNRIASTGTWVAACFAVVLSGGWSVWADERRDSGEMMRLVGPIAESVDNSVVQVLSGGRPVSLGTVVSSDGFVLTKRSELSGDPIRVRLGDGRLFPARVAAVRRRNDLAMLRVDSDVTLPPVRFASVQPPVASFVISPGRRRGRSVGIGIVGVKTARRVDHRGRLGVVLESDSSGRALVQGVWPRSGADLAGIKEGDLIVAIDGTEKNSRVGVIETLRGKFPGEQVHLTILRPDESSGLQTLEMDASIREFGVMRESKSDSKVNGPRNVRLTGFDRVIQHDTVLDVDECGGPVLDTSGRVVGINIARAGRVVSYALPSSLVLPEMISMLEEARAAAN